MCVRRCRFGLKASVNCASFLERACSATLALTANEVDIVRKLLLRDGDKICRPECENLYKKCDEFLKGINEL